jgi:hypothetical protein
LFDFQGGGRTKAVAEQVEFINDQLDEVYTKASYALISDDLPPHIRDHQYQVCYMHKYESSPHK